MRYQTIHLDKSHNSVSRILEGVMDHGVVVTVPPQLEGEQRVAEFYSEVADRLGEAVPMDENLASGNKTGERWIEVKYDPSVRESFRHSNARQPLHTDGAYESDAPEVAFLYCLEPATVGGFTTFISAPELIDLISLADPDMLGLLEGVPIKFSKGDDSKTRPVVVRSGGRTELNWNYFRVDRQSPKEVIDLSERFHSFLEGCVTQLGTLTRIKLSKGEAVFFRDSAVLHGRTSFLGDRRLVKGGIKIE